MLNILFLGLVSFFTDISTEMIYPIIPLYLTSVFGATPALVGVIEGIAESLASLLKVFSGYMSDRFKKKKELAFLGYSTGIIYKIILLIAGSWLGVLVARAIDRIGKGIRTAPRDVLVSESADEEKMGHAFGLHKSLDMAGSAVGIFLAFLLLRGGGPDFNYQKFFLISIIPAIFGLCMFFFIKEKKHPHDEINRERFWKNAKKLDANLKLYLVVVFLFTLGNSSNAFLLLKAKTVGFDNVTVVLLYFIYNIVAAVLAFPLGKLSDKTGRKGILITGYAVFAAVYVGFALAFNQIFLIGMFVLYGVHTALITGVERAFVAEISPPKLKGTMLGFHSTVAGIALLPASVVTGLLWDAFGSEIPFLFGALMSVLAAVLLLLFMKKKPKTENV